MKYYSELTKKVYDTPELLEEAEKAVLEANKEKEKKLAERAERAKAVEAAFEKAQKAKQEANDLLTDFCNDYGSFHTTIKSTDKKPVADPIINFNNCFDKWFKDYFGF